jgi:transitional endoplasmic reticulum ATPase
MKKPLRSQYIRVNKQSTLIKKWVASLLLQAELEDYLIFERIERRILFLFNTKALTKDNVEDAEFIRSWLAREQLNCDAARLDENDVFAINTKKIAKLIGLNRVELSLLRFAILLHSCKPLESAAEICGDGLSETDVCDLLRPVLGESFESYYQALDSQGKLFQTGLLKSGNRWSNSRSLAGWLQVPEMLLRQVFREQKNDGSLEQMFYSAAPRSTLTKRDFSHLEPKLSLVKDYLHASFKTQETGVNILLWGPPGTGKTELARYLAQSLRKQAMEISTTDGDRDSLSAASRFDTVLENNRAPAIWITNTLAGVDPAYLRRFDLSLCLKRTVGKNKQRIARAVFKDLPVGQEMVDQIANHKAITPAHLHKASKICARLGVDNTRDTNFIVQQVLNSDLETIRAEPIKPKAPRARETPKLDYRPDLINSDTNMEQLGGLLDKDSSARICLYGPPGTGKTAWGQYLAKAIKQPLLVKRAADILDAYIGNTEKNIAAAFEEAATSKSVLLLDEVDSFLQDRTMAHRHWEIAQVNQFLTSMEHYNGLLICTTNLMDNLDPATLRRFDFKVAFDYLATGQAQQMALGLLNRLGSKPTPTEKKQLFPRLAKLRLSHGDFATLLRRYSVLKSSPDTETLIKDLRLETGFRENSSRRTIGFIRDADQQGGRLAAVAYQ